MLKADFVNEGLHWAFRMRNQRRKVLRHMLTDTSLHCRRVLGWNDMAGGGGGIPISKSRPNIRSPQPRSRILASTCPQAIYTN